MMTHDQVKWVTVVHGDDGFTTVRGYSTPRGAMLAAREYIPSWPHKLRHREVSDYGQVVYTASMSEFAEQADSPEFPEHEFCLGY